MFDIKTKNLLKEPLEKEKVQGTVKNYIDRFDTDKTSEKDRLSGANDLNQEFYSLVTDFYIHGWGRLFHFGMRKKGESFEDSLLRHEYEMIDKIDLKEGDKCLDIGCGVAGPMENFAKKYKAEIMGINNSGYQIKRAKKYIANAGLEHLCSFTECDWMNIPLEDASYDKAYQIEATCHASDRRVYVFKEIHRLLKPGALFCGYEWVMTGNYNPENEEHIAIKRDIEVSNAISNLNFAEDVTRALEQAGFEVLECTDMAKTCDPETPWYLPLLGEGVSIKMLRKSPVGRFIMRRILTVLEFFRVLPKGTLEVSKLLNLAGESLVKGGEKDIFTPMLLMVAKKR